MRDGDVLRAESSARSYRLNDLGVPLFAESFLSSDAERQRDHYDRIAAAYVEHLDYPHTEVYTDYLDRALYEAIGTRDLGVTAELCCGRGEALRLLSDRIREGIGVDISEEMLNAATLRLRTICGVMPGLRQKRIMIVVSMFLLLLEPTSPLRQSTDLAATHGGPFHGCTHCAAVTVSPTPAHYTPHKTLTVGSDGRVGFLVEDGARFARRQEVPASLPSERPLLCAASRSVPRRRADPERRLRRRRGRRVRSSISMIRLSWSSRHGCSCARRKRVRAVGLWPIRPEALSGCLAGRCQRCQRHLYPHLTAQKF